MIGNLDAGLRRIRLPIFVFAVLAASAGARSASDPTVTIVRPPAGTPLFGQVDVALEVDAGARVELFLDGQSVGVLDAPPYEIRIDVGSENRDRLLEAVVRGDDGRVVARRLSRHPAVVVHDEVDLGLRQLYVMVDDGRGNFLGLIEIARNAALEAVSLTPQSYAALYWAAFLEEKLGRYDEALHLLDKLLRRYGDDPEIRLRHGINLARRGKSGAARADLERVARFADDDAWRILAYQELAQLDPEAGDPRAVAVLDEALAVFPDDPGLRLLASFHGRPVDPVPAGDVPPSPRLRYETVREGELVAADQALIAEVESRLEGLSSTLAEIRRRIESGETDERAFRFCRDEIPPVP